jgi:hypothetical protein
MSSHAKMLSARNRWLPPIILATQESQIRRIAVRRQAGQIVCETPNLKNPITKNWAGGVAQDEGPEFKPQYCKKNK